MKGFVTLVWVILMGICDATDLETPLVHCRHWSMHDEKVIKNCSLRSNPRCVQIETPDKCQRKIACNLTGTSSDVSFMRPSNPRVLIIRAHYEWVWYYESLCIDLCTLIKESTPWPGSDLWLNETAFDVEIGNHQGPQKVIENIRIDQEDYAVHILDYFSSFPDNFITAKTTLRGCNESITSVGTAVSGPYDIAEYSCTIGTSKYRLSHCEWSESVHRQGFCTDVYELECTRTIMCNVPAFVNFIGHSWNKPSACGLSCWMFNKTVRSPEEKQDFKIGFFDPDKMEWVYTKVYGVDKDHYMQIMNLHLNDRLLNPRGNVSLTACISNNKYCGSNMLLTDMKIRNLYGQLSTVNDQNRADCNSFENLDYNATAGDQCLMHVECFNKKDISGSDFWKQMIWMYQKSIQWTHVDMHRSTATTEMCLQFNRDDYYHPVGIAPLNETFPPYWSIFRRRKHAKYIRLTTEIGSCVRLPNGTAQLVDLTSPKVEEERDSLAGFPSYNFPDDSVQCDSWMFQQWVDHHQACSVAANPRCTRIHYNADLCEMRMFCTINGSAGDVTWLRAHPNRVDEFISTLCTDMCTLIRESMPLPGYNRWMNGTTFTVRLYDQYRDKMQFIHGIKLNDENYARKVLDFFQPSRERFFTAINTITTLEGCQRQDTGSERRCLPRYPWSNECLTETLLPGCEQTSSRGCTGTIECNTTTVALASDWSYDDICTFLCQVGNAALRQSSRESDQETNYDMRMGYFDTNEDEMRYYKAYNIERAKVITLVKKNFFDMLYNNHTEIVSLSIVSRNCIEEYNNLCTSVKYRQLYGQLSMANDFFWPGCSYYEDILYYGDCAMFLQCTTAHNLSDVEFCRRMIWMHQKSLQWSTLDLKSSTARTKMRLYFDGDRMIIPPIALNTTYDVFANIMTLRGRKARTIRAVTVIRDCLPLSNGTARVIDTAPYICYNQRNFLYRSTNMSDFAPEMRRCSIITNHTDPCKRTVECKRKSPYNHFLCDWLMWMMAKSLFWPNIQAMNIWKETALVNLTIKIDTRKKWSYDHGTELSPVQISGAMTFFENFVHNKWFNGIKLESTIHRCSDYYNGTKSMPFSLIGWCDADGAMIAENVTAKPEEMQNCTEIFHNPICQVATCCQRTFRCFVKGEYTDGLNQLCRITKWLYQSAAFWTERSTQPPRRSTEWGWFAFHLTSIDLKTGVPKLLLHKTISRKLGFTRVAEAMIRHGHLDMDFYLTSRLLRCSQYFTNAIDL